ncbi:carboxymuconolactone decarboxylase family protein [Glaciecola sp. 1036]|uniref:carboxymuconolactone decarboxylase family protein n=1 Tax=Alteromonadaceae TaxID=72275 RepID=UPI003D073275
MSKFTIFDATTAPEKAKPLLENSIKAFGMIPNLHGVMAGSPELLEGYQVLHDLAQKTDFTVEQLTVVWQSINVFHNCHYCVPAHTAIATSMKVSKEVNEALRNETPLPTDELNVLRETVLELVVNRGVLSDTQKQRFLDAGFKPRNILDIILILGQKVLSNYVNHVAETPVDKPFQSFAWTKA